VFEDASFAGVQGRYPVINATLIGMLPSYAVTLIDILTNWKDTTNLAAEATWEVLQGFLGGLHKLDPKIKSKSFNLWTESYGG
jgi:carboxypeptidase D